MQIEVLLPVAAILLVALAGFFVLRRYVRILLGHTEVVRAELRRSISDLESRVSELRLQQETGAQQSKEQALRLTAEVARINEAIASFDLPASATHVPRAAERIAPPGAVEPIKAFLRSLDQTELGKSYLEIHIDRIARTLTLVPPAKQGAALELGAYMQMTPALAVLSGYREVIGGYAGPAGGQVVKTSSIDGKEVLRCPIDLFDAESDPFPYPAGRFELVLACEILEHLVADPMHMLCEVSRVLMDRGTLVLTTPNAASYTSIALAMQGVASPQIYSLYPGIGSERPHVREYTPYEIERLVTAAGFHVEYLFTEPIGGSHAQAWVHDILRRYGFAQELRGEQIYCVATKWQPPQDRYPRFLYEAR